MSGIIGPANIPEQLRGGELGVRHMRLTGVKRCMILLVLAGVATCTSGTGDHLLASRRVKLVGSWQPVRIQGFAGVLTRPDSHSPPLLTFTARRWVASDGCNGLGGIYRLRADGKFAADTEGVSTTVGCDNVPIWNAVTKASRVRVANDVLVLSGEHGSELARFRRGASTRLTGSACFPSAYPVVVRMNRVGGPAPGAAVPLAGTVTATATDSSRCSVQVGVDGAARVALHPGVYRVTGRSPQYGDGRYVCTSVQPLTVSDPGSVTTPTSVNVVCSVK